MVERYIYKLTELIIVEVEMHHILGMLALIDELKRFIAELEVR